MAVLSWMAVTLAFFLSAGNSLAAVDQNTLARVVNGILREYGVQGMFSLAVRIPYDQNTQELNLQQVFASDRRKDVKDSINTGQVYVGNRVVAAKVLTRPNRGADHAESRVVDRLFNTPNANDLLLFYVYASPCVEKCTSETHRESILQRIAPITQWPNYAVVFSTIFKPRVGPGNTEEQLRGAVQRLGDTVGLENIFRCDRQVCRSCSSGGQVAHYCFSDNLQPGPSQNWPSTSVTQPQRGRSDSPSQSRQGGRDKQSNNIDPSAGVSTGADSNTGGGQGGSGGGKGRRRRGRGKKTNQSNAVSSPQSGLEVRNTDVDSNTGKGQGGFERRKVKKVGGRRVENKRQGGGNKQKSQQAQGKKKKQTNKKKVQNGARTTQWSQEDQGRAKQQKGKQPQRRGGGQRQNIKQPQWRGGEQKKD